MYRPGKTNIADALSRLNSVEQVDHGDEYDFVRAVVESCLPVALTPNEIEEASYNDEELCLVKSCVRSGNRERCMLTSYAHVKDELCTYGELLLRGTRKVVPRGLRDKVLKLAHKGHQSIAKTKYIGFAVRSGGRGWTKMLRKCARFAMITSGCDPPDVSCFASKCSLARLQCRPVRTPAHRREHPGGGRLFQHICGGCCFEV